MGYPSTVDTGQVMPAALYADDIITATSSATLTAGAAYLSACELYASITVTQMRCQLSGTVSGNVDMGIYDANLNLLGHTGAIAAVTGIFTQNLTSNLFLSPGQYWIAWVDTVADAVYRAQATNGGTGMTPSIRSTATNLTSLPSSLASATSDNSNRVAVMALRSGGYS